MKSISKKKIMIIVLLMVSLIVQSCHTKEKKLELCGDGKLWPYYYPDLKNKNSFYTIKKHFYSNYKAAQGKEINGIVKISFHINCKGESGNYKLENYSLEYKETELENTINDQLLSIMKENSQWVPAKNEEGETVNSHKFYAFRIIDGKLVDILPK